MKRKVLGCRVLWAVLLFSGLVVGCGGGGGEKPVYASALSLNKKELTLSVGVQEKLTVAIEPEGVTHEEVEWSSSNPAVAVVDSSGEIRALRVGLTTITATLKGDGQWDLCYLEVVDPSIVGFEPKAAHHSTSLRIYGKDFSAKISETSVKLNGVSAKVLSATSSEIKVEVPQVTRCAGPERKDCTGAVEVHVGGKTVYETAFTYVPKVNVSTVAGNGDGISGHQDGPGAEAQFAAPLGIVADAAGNLYVADTGNHRIRKLEPDGAGGVYVSTLAGGDTPGFRDGSGASAWFYSPFGITMDTAGNLYVADAGNHRIRKLKPDGGGGVYVVSTLAGNGAAEGHKDGPGVSAQFSWLLDITIDAAGNLYVVEADNGSIRKLEPDGAGGVYVSTFVDNNGLQVFGPSGITIDTAGNLYAADTNNHCIRKFEPDGQGRGNFSTLAGKDMWGYVDGPGASAQFSAPLGIAVDAAGNLYVVDSGNSRIRKLEPDGAGGVYVSTLAGDGTWSHRDGPGAEAQFAGPYGITIDAAGSLYVTEEGGHRIRKITFE